MKNLFLAILLFATVSTVALAQDEQPAAVCHTPEMMTSAIATAAPDKHLDQFLTIPSVDLGYTKPTNVVVLEVAADDGEVAYLGVAFLEGCAVDIHPMDAKQLEEFLNDHIKRA